MPTEDEKEVEKRTPRNEKGHFVNTKTHVEGSAGAVSDLLKVKEVKEDETLIDLKIANPLHKITKLLQEIKDRQSTTVSMRFTIPLIALPVVILLVFQMGRVQAACSPVFMTKMGTLMRISQDVPVENEGVVQWVVNHVPFVSQPDPSNNYQNVLGAILVEQDGNIVTVSPPEMAGVGSFENQNVLISGKYSECTNTLFVASPNNVTLR